MAPDKKSRFNLMIGLLLASLVTLPTLLIVVGDVRQPSFLPGNAWLWPALWILLLVGWLGALFGLLRKLHWGFFLWSQMTLSFLVLILYIGRHRADRDYAKFGADPGAVIQGPPEVLWHRFAFLVLIWLAVGFLPLALRSLWLWVRAHRPGSQGASHEH